MKRVMIVVCMLCAQWLWQNEAAAQSKDQKYRSGAGIGISTLLNGSWEVVTEYSFARQWSVSASAGIGIRNPVCSQNEESIAHHMEFVGSSVKTSSKKHTSFGRFAFSYWPQGTFNGINIGVGGEVISHEDLDAVISIGYDFTIYRQIHANLSHSMRCLTSLKKSVKDAQATEVKLIYRF
jgi:hypothetical protein